MARQVRVAPDGSNPTRAIRSGFYERPPAFGGRLAPGEADAEARSAPVRSGLSRDTFVKVSVFVPVPVCFPHRWRALHLKPANTSLGCCSLRAATHGCSGMHALVAADEHAWARR